MDRQDNGQSIDEKVTILVAAKALKVSTKTVHRYIEKGLLTKVKEGTRVYVPMDEIRSILNGHRSIDKSLPVQEKDHVSVDRGHYDGLLTRLGQLEAKQELLLEYKAALEGKDRDITETRAALSKANEALTQLVKIKQDAEQKAKALLDQQAEIEQLQAENDRLKIPWWRRWIGGR